MCSSLDVKIWLCLISLNMVELLPIRRKQGDITRQLRPMFGTSVCIQRLTHRMGNKQAVKNRTPSPKPQTPKRRPEMKGYAANDDVPLSLRIERTGPREDLDVLLEKGISGGCRVLLDRSGRERGLKRRGRGRRGGDRFVDDEYAQDESEISDSAAEAGGDFETTTSPAICAKSLPIRFFSPDKEIELAQTIRQGQNQLVQLYCGPRIILSGVARPQTQDRKASRQREESPGCA